MANVLFCSDLHLGHINIQKFRTHVTSEEHNRQLIVEDWKASVTKRDVVFVLGDACFSNESVDVISALPGKKYLIRGNHDKLSTNRYLEAFDEVYGILAYKEFWLSHAPIHPDELRGRVNLHGHVHYASIRKHFNPVYDVKQEEDKRYFNCCVENLIALKRKSLISLDEIRAMYK